MDNFNEVWERVSGSPKAAPKDDAETLRGFMDDEAADCGFYTALAARCRAASRSLLCIAAEERGHLRRHQMEYFLITGDSYVPSPSCPVIRGTLSALRTAYLDEKAANRAYLKAAGETDNEVLKEQYREIAGDEARHADILRGLMEKAL